MRQKILFVVFLALLGGVAFVFAMRGGYEPIASSASDETEGDAGEGEGSDGRDAEDGDSATETERADAGQGDDGTGDSSPLMDRTLRTVGLGWDSIMPGLLLSLDAEAEGSFASRGVPAEFAAVATPEAVGAALARGGEDDEGADIAIMPLVSLVESYERLRALEPQVFFVVGWSHGRHVLFGRDPSLPLSLDDAGRIALQGEASDPATLFALLLLDLAGADLSEVTLGQTGAFRAVDGAAVGNNGRPQGLEAIVSTADAPALMPLVAVAPRGFLDNHQSAVQAWSEAWLQSVDAMRSDVPGAARRAASQTGAPNAVRLLELLGQVDFADLADNAQLTGLSGRSAVTLDRVFSFSWSALREASLLTTPAPSTAPVDVRTIQALVLSGQPVPSPRRVSVDHSTEPMIQFSHPRGELDEERFIDDLGFVAGLFPSSAITIRLGSRRADGDGVVEQVTDRFGLDPRRFEVDRTPARRHAAEVDIRSAR